MKDYRSIPIPVVADPGNCKEIAFIDSPLVEIKENDKLEIQMQYPVLGFKNAEKRCFARKEVADMLYKAAESLPEGYKFRVWDLWRPFALQKELFTSYSAKIIKEFHLENLSEEERVAEISKFVANPVHDATYPPAHTTGGAIDLTMVGPDGNELEFGTAFDAFTDKTRAGYYETDAAKSEPDAEVIRGNRRMLYHTMTAAGFTNLPSEWWHYEYGDKNWAFVTRKPALYNGIFEVE